MELRNRSAAMLAAALAMGCMCEGARGEPGPQPVQFYVAPNGDDRWSGSLPAANAAGTDGPLASPAAARDAVRRLKRRQGGRLRQPVTVLIRGGDYYLKLKTLSRIE